MRQYFEGGDLKRINFDVIITFKKISHFSAGFGIFYFALRNTVKPLHIFPPT